jgi:2-dehydropantoate 2-reductase
VLGSGAMGSLFGARLARAGHAVTLTGTWSEALEAARHRGVVVEDETGSWSAPVRAVTSSEALWPHELVLVLVKSHQTPSVAGAAARAAGIGGWIVTLQNGLGNRESLEARAGRGRVGLGVTQSGATLLAPAHVRGFSAPTLLGDDGVGRAARVAVLLSAAGIECHVEADIDRLVWRKLAVNCAINALSALAGVRNGALLERPEWREQLAAAAHETAAVARALGIDIGGDPAELACETARLTADNRSSMLQDLQRGVRTEIDALNGAVVRLGRGSGIATPQNAALVGAIHAREAALLAGAR